MPKKPHRSFLEKMNKPVITLTPARIINANTCPGCGGPGQKLGAEDCDYNCVNGFCDVRTFRPRRKSATTDNKPRTTGKGA